MTSVARIKKNLHMNPEVFLMSLWGLMAATPVSVWGARQMKVTIVRPTLLRRNLWRFSTSLITFLTQQSTIRHTALPKSHRFMVKRWKGKLQNGLVGCRSSWNHRHLARWTWSASLDFYTILRWPGMIAPFTQVQPFGFYHTYKIVSWGRTYRSFFPKV